MSNRAALSAAVLAVLAAAPLAACSSGPSHPSWCAPLIAQLHTRLHQQQFTAALTALEPSGAPVTKLITDIGTYGKDQAAANIPGTDSFAALADEPEALAKVGADLKQLNAQCGQPADAYKSDYF